MRKFLSLLVLFFAVGELSAQVDSTRRHAIIFGTGTAAGFSITDQQLPDRYDELVFGNKAYAQFAADITVLWKEQFGFRIAFGRVGRFAQANDFTQFVDENYPGFKFLPEYSYVKSGFSYTYICPQFAYRFGSEPFNLTLYGGAGFGKLNIPNATAQLQEEGSNNYKTVSFLADDDMNMHLNFNCEFGYMRQLSQHWFSNFGLYANCVAVKADYTYIYTEQEFAQPTSVFNFNSGDYFHTTLNVGVFLNFQWNKRESERAYYE